MEAQYGPLFLSNYQMAPLVAQNEEEVKGPQFTRPIPSRGRLFGNAQAPDNHPQCRGGLAGCKEISPRLLTGQLDTQPLPPLPPCAPSRACRWQSSKDTTKDAQVGQTQENAMAKTAAAISELVDVGASVKDFVASAQQLNISRRAAKATQPLAPSPQLRSSKTVPQPPTLAQRESINSELPFDEDEVDDVAELERPLPPGTVQDMELPRAPPRSAQATVLSKSLSPPATIENPAASYESEGNRPPPVYFTTPPLPTLGGFTLAEAAADVQEELSLYYSSQNPASATGDWGPERPPSSQRSSLHGSLASSNFEYDALKMYDDLEPQPEPGCHGSQVYQPPSFFSKSNMSTTISNAKDAIIGDRGCAPEQEPGNGDIQKCEPTVSLTAPAPMSKRIYRVRVPPAYPGVQFRRSKDLSDRYPRYVLDGALVAGDIDGEWLRVDADAFLPRRVGDTEVLEAYVSCEARGPEAGTRQDQQYCWMPLPCCRVATTNTTEITFGRRPECARPDDELSGPCNDVELTGDWRADWADGLKWK